MKLVRALALSLLIWGVCPAEPLSVCEVLSSLSALNGRSISVRGVWGKGDTGEVLTPETPCERPIVRDGWRFWNTIDIVPDQGKAAAAQYYGRRHDLLNRHRGESVKLVGVFMGKLETREHFRVHTFPSGEQAPEAYRYFVARVRYTRVRELHLVPTTKQEVDDLLEQGRRPAPRLLVQSGVAPEAPGRQLERR
jgi:hypothetical protein